MSDHDRRERSRRTGTRTGMVHISVALDEAMAGIIQRACAAGHPPPSFKTDGYDHPDDAPPPEPPPPPAR